jgi:hypothetical protein
MISRVTPEVKNKNVVGYMWVKKTMVGDLPGGLCKFSHLQSRV